MNIQKTNIKGVYIIELDPKNDERGFFLTSFYKQEFESNGLPHELLQTNRSFTTTKGTIRGIHFQKAPFSQDKLVECLVGAMYDVVIDLRPKSETYKQWIAIELNNQNKKMIFVPQGLAHGFQTLTNNCLMQYHIMSNYYMPDYESGVLWNDPVFNISWPIPNPLLNKRDKTWPIFKG